MDEYISEAHYKKLVTIRNQFAVIGFLSGVIVTMIIMLILRN